MGVSDLSKTTAAFSFCVLVFASLCCSVSASALVEFEKIGRFCEGESEACLEPMSSSFSCLCPPKSQCVGADGFFEAAYCRTSWPPTSMVYVQGDSNDIFHAWWAQKNWDNRYPMKRVLPK